MAIDFNELVDADDINKTKTGEIRKRYPEIHQKLSEGGWAAKDMVEWFGERAIHVPVELFRVYLRDIDREHGCDRFAKKRLHINKQQHANPRNNLGCSGGGIARPA